MSKNTQRVARGAALLDDEIPGWRDRIDCDALDLGDCEACVLGHLYGDFVLGLYALGIDEGTAVDLGFEVGDVLDTARSYTWLTKAWRKVLGCV